MQGKTVRRALKRPIRPALVSAFALGFAVGIAASPANAEEANGTRTVLTGADRVEPTPAEAVLPDLLEEPDDDSVACGPVIGLVGSENPEGPMMKTPLFINPGIGNGSFDYYGIELDAYRTFEPVLTIRILAKTGREISKTVFDNWIEDRGYMRLNDDILNFVQYDMTDIFDRYLNMNADDLRSVDPGTIPSRAVFEFTDRNGKALCIYIYNYAASFH